MSVMDMLAANEAAEAAKNGPGGGGGGGERRGKGTGRANGGGMETGKSSSSSNSNRTAPASEVSSADDASGDEAGLGGDAMDEDVAGDGDESEEGEESDSDEDGEDKDDRHARLLGFVGTLGDQAAAAQRAAEDRRSSQLLKEGEFNATAVAATSGGGGGSPMRGAVTMEVRGKERCHGKQHKMWVCRRFNLKKYSFIFCAASRGPYLDGKNASYYVQMCIRRKYAVPERRASKPQSAEQVAREPFPFRGSASLGPALMSPRFPAPLFFQL